MKLFITIVHGISGWTGRIIAFMVVLATLQITYEVVMRYVFNNPSFWALEITAWLCASMYALGGAYASIHDAHVRVDVLYMRWNARVRAIVDMLTSPFFFIGVAVMCWAGAEWTIKAYVEKTTSLSHWEPLIWPIRLFLPVGSFLLLLEGLVKFINDFGVARRGNRA